MEDNLNGSGSVGVSVPLRGKGRDQHFLKTSPFGGPYAVSVPLRGKGRDQPLADVVKEVIPSGFRPLAGKR